MGHTNNKKETAYQMGCTLGLTVYMQINAINKPNRKQTNIILD